MKHAFAGYAAAALLSLAAAAHADTKNIEFKSLTPYGSFDATATLDVENGFAVSGAGSITGDHLGTQTLTLLTASSPGAEPGPNGTFGYRSNGGDDFGYFDNQNPYDFMFALGPNSPGFGQNVTLSIYSTDDAATTYNSALFGFSQDDTRFYQYNTPASFDEVGAVSAAPEPGTWALMFAGVAMLGAMLRFAPRRRDAALAA